MGTVILLPSILYRNYTKFIIRTTVTVFILFFCISCENFVEGDPPKTELVSSTVFEDDRTATAVMTGIYSRMMTSFGFASGSLNSITVLSALSADETENYSPSSTASYSFYSHTLLPGDVTVGNYFWNEPYQYIYTVNIILEQLREVTGVTASVKKQLEGEARFIRGFCYFYLVNFFGDVPLHLTSDYRKNSERPRSPIIEVYEQIITDLKIAQELLTNDYSFSEGQRTRPNTWTATALLARVYLYIKDWENAEIEASRVIDNTAMFQLLNNIDKVFLKNSKEAIWQLMPVRPRFNTMEAFQFILVRTPPTTQAISEELINAFESGDLRKSEWIDSIMDGNSTWYYPYKYKIRQGKEDNLVEYSMVFRLAEQYLIRSEARAQQGNINEALEDLNIIRSRAGLENIEVLKQTKLLDAILQERQVELFTEWGHRWLDLKRTGRADAVLERIKPLWKSTAVFYPIPLNEILRNPHITQNMGY